MSNRAAAFLEQYPDLEFVDLMIPDINGVARGKRVPADGLVKAFEAGIALPASIFALDITGATVDSTGLIWETGDADYACMPLAQTLVPCHWSKRPSAQTLLTMEDPQGKPFFAEPRVVLQTVLQRIKSLGFTPHVAFELEFYIYQLEDGEPCAPRSRTTGLPEEQTQVYDLDTLDHNGPLLEDIEAACRQQGLAAEAAVAEYAPGQFEINLIHRPDALRAADEAWLLKRLIRQVARRHDLQASFMAKPYAELAGSGMHMHISLVDERGLNAFGGKPGRLEQAIAGVLAALPESVALFAPHANSFRRFRPDSYAPLWACWGHNNRTVAVRVPQSDADNLRIEHRFAGADCNPYLSLAAVLAGMAHGLSSDLTPPPPIGGNAYEQTDGQVSLSRTWNAALNALDQAEVLREWLDPRFLDLYSAIKHQEYRHFERRITPLEYAWYLDRV